MEQTPEVTPGASPELTSQPIEPEGGSNTAQALIFGLAAALAGAGIWYGIALASGTRIGIIAVAMGFLVGFAVKSGAGRGALNMQLLGAALALVSLVAGEYLILNHFENLASEGASGWLSGGQFLEQYKDVVLQGPVTLLFYAVALYEGFMIPKPD